MTQSEAELQEWVALYLRNEYPNVIFHSDFGSGAKLTPRQAMRQKRQNGGRRAWPDIFIAEPDREVGEIYVAGLFIELKKGGSRLKRKDGTWATPHIAEQAKLLDELACRGYRAEFAVGFNEAKKIIDEYLGRSPE